MGIVNLATVAFSDGSWALFKGGSVLAEYGNYSRQIALTQKRLSIHGQRGSKKLRVLYLKRRGFLKHAVNSLSRMVLETAYDKGVSTIMVGYPKDIAQRHGGKLTTNFWNYDYWEAQGCWR